MLLFVIPYIIIIYSLRKEVDIMNYISVKAASENGAYRKDGYKNYVRKIALTELKIWSCMDDTKRCRKTR